MLFNSQEEVNQSLKGIVSRDNGNLIIDDAEKLRGGILDQIVLNADEYHLRLPRPQGAELGVSQFCLLNPMLLEFQHYRHGQSPIFGPFLQSDTLHQCEHLTIRDMHPSLSEVVRDPALLEGRGHPV